MARKRDGLHSACPLGVPKRFRAGEIVSSGPKSEWADGPHHPGRDPNYKALGTTPPHTTTLETTAQCTIAAQTTAPRTTHHNPRNYTITPHTPTHHDPTHHNTRALTSP